MRCRRKRAATLLQSAWRGRILRQRFQAQRRAAVRLQAVWRGHLQRARFELVRPPQSVAQVRTAHSRCLMG